MKIITSPKRIYNFETRTHIIRVFGNLLTEKIAHFTHLVHPLLDRTRKWSRYQSECKAAVWLGRTRSALLGPSHRISVLVI